MNTNITEIWSKTLESVKKSISSEVGYNVHIKAAVPIKLENDIITVSVPTSINKNMIEFRYKNFIEASLEKVTGKKLSLCIITDGEKIKDTDIKKAENISKSNVIGVNPKYTFDNFVVGSSNEYANAAAKKTAETPGEVYNPLFIYGNSGLGKTHLMHAIGNSIRENFPSLKVVYVPCETFTNEFIAAIREYTTEKFRNKYRAADVLLVDDVQFLENKEAVQEEFFHTFNELFNCNKQIVLTSDRKPGELKTLTERIRQRFGQGLTIDISIPNYETRIAILQKKAQSHNTSIDEKIFEYIAENIRSSVRELEGALLKIISMSEISDIPITMEFAEKTLKTVLPDEDNLKITPQKIIQKVSLYYRINENELTGKIKIKEIAVPRQIAMYLCSTMTDMNFKAIGKVFGKDRSTVDHNVKKIKTDINTDEKLKNDIDYIIKDIESA